MCIGCVGCVGVGGAAGGVGTPQDIPINEDMLAFFAIA